MKKLIFFIPLLLAACSNPEPNPEVVAPIIPGEGETPDYNPAEVPEFVYTLQPFAAQRADDRESYPSGNPDFNPGETEWSNVVKVVFSGATASVQGASEAGVTASVSGANVDLNLGSSRTVRIVASGASDCGSLRLTGAYKHLLELNNLSLKSADRPAINDQIKKRLFLVVRGENKLEDGADYLAVSEDRKGCLFAEDHIVVCGDGRLQIKGNYRHGLATDGYLYVNPGVTLAVTDAVKNAIHAKGSSKNEMRGIEITGGYVYASTSAPAGKALKSDANISVRGGAVYAAASGATAVDELGLLSSAACLKSDMNITVSGGKLTAVSPANGAKGLNADGNITISGALTTIALSGDAEANGQDAAVPKAVNAHGSLAVSAGGLSVSAVGAGATALSSDVDFAMSGGVVYAYASNNGLKAPSAEVSNGVFLCGGMKNSPCRGVEQLEFQAVAEADLTQVFNGEALGRSFLWPQALSPASLLVR